MDDLSGNASWHVNDVISNSSVWSNHDCPVMESGETRVLSISVRIASMMVLFVASLVANVAVFVVFCRKPVLLNTSNIFVLNLAICNGLMTVLIMPVICVSTVNGDWLLDAIWCEVVGVTSSVLIVACMMTLLAISLDRFYAIMKALHYDLHMTKNKVICLVILIWIVSVGVCLPPVFGWGRITYQPATGLCTVAWSSRRVQDRIYALAIVVTCFIIPYSIMSYVYVSVFRATQRTTAQARRNSVTPDVGDVNAVQHTVVPRRRSSAQSLLQAARRCSTTTTRNLLAALHRDDWKAAKTSVLVMFSLTICWLPYFCVIAFEAILTLPCGVPEWVHTSSMWTAMLSCALNPVVYVFRSTPIRSELRGVLKRSAGSLRKAGITRAATLNGHGGPLERLRESRRLSLAAESSRRSSIGSTASSAPVIQPNGRPFLPRKSSLASLSVSQDTPRYSGPPRKTTFVLYNEMSRNRECAEV